MHSVYNVVKYTWCIKQNNFKPYLCEASLEQVKYSAPEAKTKKTANKPNFSVMIPCMYNKVISFIMPKDALV